MTKELAFSGIAECSIITEFVDLADIAEVLADVQAVDPLQSAVREADARVLPDAIAVLPLQFREVLILRHLQGLTFPEIARRLERTVDSVEKVWTRALGKLRRALGGMA